MFKQRSQFLTKKHVIIILRFVTVFIGLQECQTINENIEIDAITLFASAHYKTAK